VLHPLIILARKPVVAFLSVTLCWVHVIQPRKHMCDICTFAGANSVTDSALGSKNLHLKLQLQLQLACQASVLGCL